MTCKDCQNEEYFPDKTKNLECVSLESVSDNQDVIGVGPTSFYISQNNANGVQYVRNLVRDLSRRFGKVQPGILFEDEDTQKLGIEINEIFEELEDNLQKVYDQVNEREQQINDEIKTQLEKSSCTSKGCGDCDFEKPCENAFDGFKIPPVGMDWINPITPSTLLKVGQCRINFGCKLCDLPGDINIPPFPGIPTCNFVPVKSCICGEDFINPFATTLNILNGFQLFATQLGQFSYAFFDIANLLTGFLGRCIMRIIECLGIFLGDFSFYKSISQIGASVREQIDSSTALINSAFAKIKAIVISIQTIIVTAINELFRFVQAILDLCDPCKLVKAIANPSSVPEIVSEASGI